MPKLRAREAFKRLKEGNLRFTGSMTGDAEMQGATRPKLSKATDPFAIILGCSDARVPAEIIFDSGLGDLFVIRVAGNIIAPSLVGSVEFAAARFGTRLVVVLGHTSCGAILATIEELTQHGGAQSPNLQSIVNRVRPSVLPLMNTELRHDLHALSREAVRANIRASANHLRHGSELMEKLIEQKGFRVVGAEYSLESGMVD